MRGLDAWITSGRYSKDLIVVTCPTCETDTPVVAETEYGATEWSPGECSKCGRSFEGDEQWVEDEPPEREAE
jgi:hypothetical protein